MYNKEIYLNPDHPYRIIAISDIHGHPEVLMKLLDKVNLQDDDYLVILGDFINKGLDSYGSYQLIRQLAERDRTYILKGNHEFYTASFMQDESTFLQYFDPLILAPYETIFDGLFIEQNITREDFKTPSEMYHFLIRYYQPVFDYLRNLPVLLHINESTFVHGGYDPDFDLHRDEYRYLKFNHYNDLSPIHQRKIIVGHWPVVNLRHDQLSNTPYHNEEKNILFIDGGLGVKKTGELNAVIIECDDHDIQYSFIQENTFSHHQIINEHYFDIEEAIHINYPSYRNFDVMIIEEKEHTIVCQHSTSGHIFTTFPSLLERKGNQGRLLINYINHFLNLPIGEWIEVCQLYDDCVLVKYQDRFGWILRSQIAA